MLSPEDYRAFSWQYINQIVEALSEVALCGGFLAKVVGLH
ncbi:hypothetical protein BPO_1344 [Bergeyella porcorum]|uniref:Uncharacterized protein n=1 Tax=Bergeyella porcorum TaxID=1735111 RepID=A0AAU0F1P8_9FLAO